MKNCANNQQEKFFQDIREHYELLGCKVKNIEQRGNKVVLTVELPECPELEDITIDLREEK
jgi:hypothetical protein